MSLFIRRWPRRPGDEQPPLPQSGGQFPVVRLQGSTLCRWAQWRLAGVGSLSFRHGPPGDGPANAVHCNNVDLLLCHRRRRWPNIKSTLFQCTVFAGGGGASLIKPGGDVVGWPRGHTPGGSQPAGPHGWLQGNPPMRDVATWLRPRKSCPILSTSRQLEWCHRPTACPYNRPGAEAIRIVSNHPGGTTTIMRISA